MTNDATVHGELDRPSAPRGRRIYVYVWLTLFTTGGVMLFAGGPVATPGIAVVALSLAGAVPLIRKR